MARERVRRDTCVGSMKNFDGGSHNNNNNLSVNRTEELLEMDDGEETGNSSVVLALVDSSRICTDLVKSHRLPDQWNFQTGQAEIHIPVPGTFALLPWVCIWRRK